LGKVDGPIVQHLVWLNDCNSAISVGVRPSVTSLFLVVT